MPLTPQSPHVHSQDYLHDIGSVHMAHDTAYTSSRSCKSPKTYKHGFERYHRDGEGMTSPQVDTLSTV